MGDRQKQIEGMAQAMSDFVLEDSTKCDIELSRHLIAKGYRKQSETAREVIIKLLSIIQNEYEYYPDGITLGAYAQLRKEINELAAEYNVEV